jgi:hypothetical protein
MEQCQTCFRAKDKIDTCLWNGEVMCNKCAGKLLRYTWGGKNKKDCPHPNFFFKEWKFYCRTCGSVENEC